MKKKFKIIDTSSGEKLKLGGGRSVSILSIIGFVILCLFSISLVIGGLLNLGGCGDRIGDKYKGSNWIQIVVGIVLLILAFVLL